MAINKVIYGNEAIIDLTEDTVTVDTLLQGTKAHDKTGAIITGTCTFDSDTKDATAGVAEVLVGKTYYAGGEKKTGTMPNIGSVSGSITTLTQQYAIETGFHDGAGKVSIDATEQSKCIPANIKQGITLLGVEGTYTGEAIQAQSKEVTPSKEQQLVQPDLGYDYLSSVTVKAIPYSTEENEAGGTTVKIGA